jgi:complement component 1 Q subcomponent-binding protein
MALARRLLRLRPHLGALPLPSPSPPCFLPSHTYISDLRRSAFIDRLLRSIRSEISMLDDSTPPLPPPPPAPFAVEDPRASSGPTCARVFPAAEGEEEEVTVDATLVDDALPPTRSGADTGGPPWLHITVARWCSLLSGCILPRVARPC